MDILGMLVRQDRVKAILEKKKIEYTEEEKNKEKGGPITFDDSDDEFLDLLLSEYEDDEDQEEEDDEIDTSLPIIDFVYTPPTLEEKVQQRLDSLANSLYHMKEIPFVKLCIKEGILSENHIY